MAVDDKQIFAVRRDISDGMNNRQHGSNIGEKQMTLLKNIDIGVRGEAIKRRGLTLVEDLSNDAGYGLFGFEPAGGTNELLAIHGTKLEGYVGSGSFTEHKTDFTAGTIATIIKAGESGENDVVLVYIDGNNWFRMNQSYSFQDLGDINTSPPLSEVALNFRNRVWVLKDDLLHYSDVFPADYSLAFDRSADNYRIPVGAERALVGIRDLGIIAFGEDQVWSLNPSVTPAATDKAERILDIGCVAGDTVVQVFDDILFLARDGVRGLFRTQQDKIQAGASFPLSFPLKDEYESINWGQIQKATAVFFDNKYIISLPVDSSTTNNEVWVFYPAFQSWVIISGWNVGAWAKVRFSGEEKLYAIDSTNGQVYQAFNGFDDNKRTLTASKSGTTVTSTVGTFESGDVGRSLIWDNGTVDVVSSFSDANNVTVQSSATISSQELVVGAIDYDEQGRKEDFGQPLITKTGGEVKIKAFSSGSYDLTIQVSIDDQDWTTLGTMNLAGNAPALPVSLPFDLADDNLITKTFHLDTLGPFNQIRLRIRHNATNGSDDIKIFERQIVTFADEYQAE